MKITITIECDNAAFRPDVPGFEAARILGLVSAHDINESVRIARRTGEAVSLSLPLDANGNTAARGTVTP